ITRPGPIRRYLKKSVKRGLHLGCGVNVHNDWLNTDLQVCRRGVVFLDATKPFPLPNGCMHYVFSEHMIEHLTYAQGLNLLRESFRVLKSGGRIRIATPNLEVLLRLYYESTSPGAHDYVEWFARRHFSAVESLSPTFVINHFFYSWGHNFIYD